MSFTGLVIVCTIAFVAPLLLGLVPRVRLPPIVLEILAGIAVGPAGLGWVTLDEPIRVLSVLGLAFLLFLSGLELDLTMLTGRPLRLATVGFGISAIVACAIAYALHLAGIVESVLLVAICLLATGIVLPVVKDAELLATDFGQTLMVSSSVADLGTVLLLSLLFSRESSGALTKLVLLGGFAVLIGAIVLGLTVAKHWRSLGSALLRLQDSTSQIRIRGAFLMMVALVALATRQGLEAILGAFVAGALVSILDRDYKITHPKFHEKLSVIGFSVFIPVFFVASGITFDTGVFTSAAALARVPLFLAALFVAHGIPAIVYRPVFGPRRALAAALLQATSLPFVVAAAAIGLELHALAPENASALIAAGLLAVVLFPASALALLRRDAAETAASAVPA